MSLALNLGSLHITVELQSLGSDSNQQCLTSTFFALPNPLHVSPGATANEIQRNMTDWISSGQESDGNQFTSETCPHRVIFVGMMNGVPISPQAPKEGFEKFLQDAKKNAESFNKFEPGNFSYVGPGSEETWNFEKYADNPQKM